VIKVFVDAMVNVLPHFWDDRPLSLYAAVGEFGNLEAVGLGRSTNAADAGGGDEEVAVGQHGPGGLEAEVHALLRCGRFHLLHGGAIAEGCGCLIAEMPYGTRITVFELIGNAILAVARETLLAHR